MKVKIWKDEAMFSLKMLFYVDNNGKRVIFNPSTKRYTEYSEGMQISPDDIMEIPGDDTLQQLAEEISKQGAKTENEYKLQGILDATKNHLSDMRQLLKLK